jgi:hypothetical protein
MVFAPIAGKDSIPSSPETERKKFGVKRSEFGARKEKLGVKRSEFGARKEKSGDFLS